MRLRLDIRLEIRNAVIEFVIYFVGVSVKLEDVVKRPFSQMMLQFQCCGGVSLLKLCSSKVSEIFVPNEIKSVRK